MTNQERVQQIKELYPKGSRVKCIEMRDAHAVPRGTKGTVVLVDDIGTVHVNWDNGQSLGLIVGEDRFHAVFEYQTCCICGREFEGMGNNPEPVKHEGVCCDDCNAEVVIPARIEQMINGKEQTNA